MLPLSQPAKETDVLVDNGHVSSSSLRGRRGLNSANRLALLLVIPDGRCFTVLLASLCFPSLSSAFVLLASDSVGNQNSKSKRTRDGKGPSPWQLVRSWEGGVWGPLKSSGSLLWGLGGLAGHQSMSPCPRESEDDPRLLSVSRSHAWSLIP